MAGGALHPLISEFMVARAEADTPAKARTVRARFCVLAFRALLETDRQRRALEAVLEDLECRLATMRLKVRA